MIVSNYIESLQREGDRFAENAAKINLNATVPTCPEWSLRDLIRRLGGIHPWAGSHVREGNSSILQVNDL